MPEFADAIERAFEVFVNKIGTLFSMPAAAAGDDRV
jgi:hypothetical protein